ncbi:ADM_collapsed_G0054650.mRNA.1.CDS.1 [Saccharomyces cerevisiae]|nr:ADM_collapsed_G0054650.mRNA.1.CDS.1 [Saccharomyces cerevisiae]
MTLLMPRYLTDLTPVSSQASLSVGSTDFELWPYKEAQSACNDCVIGKDIDILFLKTKKLLITQV